jgi:hypothetical protein
MYGRRKRNWKRRIAGNAPMRMLSSVAAWHNWHIATQNYDMAER